jgi:hypothetical protein
VGDANLARSFDRGYPATKIICDAIDIPEIDSGRRHAILHKVLLERNSSSTFVLELRS